MPAPGLLASYERERRPVGYRNRLASERHTDVRMKIAELYQNERDPDALARGIAALGNAENESWGIEFGYRYDGVEPHPTRLRSRPPRPARACPASSCATARPSTTGWAAGSPCCASATPIRRP